MRWTPAHAENMTPRLTDYLGGRREYTATVPAMIVEAIISLPDLADGADDLVVRFVRLVRA